MIGTGGPDVPSVNKALERIAGETVVCQIMCPLSQL